MRERTWACATDQESSQTKKEYVKITSPEDLEETNKKISDLLGIVQEDAEQS